jgi:hypothetical protein
VEEKLTAPWREKGIKTFSMKVYDGGNGFEVPVER